MVLPSYKECKAIYQELLELVEISRPTKAGLDTTPQQLAACFDQREQDEDYRMRIRLALSTTSRLIEHQRLTGHNVPLPLSQGGLNNLN